MNDKEYFIAEDDEQKGPFSFNELKEMGISKTTFVWKQGFVDWTKAGEIEELQSLLKITPPKFPKSENKKKKTDKTLNVNLDFGKQKTSFELKEKELAKEKLKGSIAKNTIFYIQRILISIFIVVIFLVFHYNLEPSMYNVPGEISEEYVQFSKNSEIMFFILLAICFLLIFGRPLSQIFLWFKIYSEKDI